MEFLWISDFVDWSIHVQVMAFQAGRSKQQVAQEVKMKGGMPPGFTDKRSMKVDPYGGSGSSNPQSGSGAFSSSVPDVGSFFGASNSSSSSMKDDFDSFLDDAAPGVGAPSTGVGMVAGRDEVKRAVSAGGKTEGLFLPYLPQDDAVAAGLGAKDGGIDASEAQEVVDQLNRQLASLLRCSPPEFWQKGVHRAIPLCRHDVYVLLLGPAILMNTFEDRFRYSHWVQRFTYVSPVSQGGR